MLHLLSSRVSAQPGWVHRAVRLFGDHGSGTYRTAYAVVKTIANVHCGRTCVRQSDTDPNLGQLRDGAVQLTRRDALPTRVPRVPLKHTVYLFLFQHTLLLPTKENVTILATLIAVAFLGVHPGLSTTAHPEEQVEDYESAPLGRDPLQRPVKNSNSW